MFRNAHAVSKQNRPISDFIWLAKLDKVKGIDPGESGTYLNGKACLNFIQCIADSERHKIINRLSSVPYFSFMMDGSTDISGDEQETIYVRFVDKGTVHEHFLDIGSPISTCSQNLYEHVISTFQKRGIHDHAKDEITLFFYQIHVHIIE